MNNAMMRNSFDEINMQFCQLMGMIAQTQYFDHERISDKGPDCANNILTRTWKELGTLRRKFETEADQILYLARSGTSRSEDINNLQIAFEYAGVNMPSIKINYTKNSSYISMYFLSDMLINMDENQILNLTIHLMHRFEGRIIRSEMFEYNRDQLTMFTLMLTL